MLWQYNWTGWGSQSPSLLAWIQEQSEGKNPSILPQREEALHSQKEALHSQLWRLQDLGRQVTLQCCCNVWLTGMLKYSPESPPKEAKGARRQTLENSWVQTPWHHLMPHHCLIWALERQIQQKKAKDSFWGNRCDRVKSKQKTGEKIAKIRQFSGQVRAHLCAYQKVWCKHQEKVANNKENKSALATDPISINKLVKQFKTHRCALDFDHSFCKATHIDLTNN